MAMQGSAHRSAVAGVIVAVLGVGTAAAALGETLGADTGLIVPGRGAVTVSGVLRCTAGQSGLMEVTVAQRARRAVGAAHVRCDGRQMKWAVRARAGQGARLSPGRAGITVTITFGAGGNTQHVFGVASSLRLRCPSTRRRDGTIEDISLRAPGARSQAHGDARISRHRGRWRISIAAQQLAPNGRHDAYAVWLYSTRDDARLLGFVNPGAGKDGRIHAVGVLPGTVGCYREVVVSRETTATPAHPGTIVLRGPIKLW